jgi:predicted dehydrogenase
MFTAAIIGCGNIAGGYDENLKAPGVYTHAGGFRKSGVQIRAAADINPKRLKSFAKYWGVDKIYPGYDELIQEGPYDIVSVCTPDRTHFEIISRLIENRSAKVVLAEKPLAMSSAEANQIIQDAEAAGIKIVLNNQRRWEPHHGKLRDSLRDGGIGIIQSVCAYYTKGLFHIGCTVVDTIRYLIDEVESVLALPPQDRGSLPEDPTIDCILFLRNEAKAVMLGCDLSGQKYGIFELDIMGTEGRVRYEDEGHRLHFCEIEEYSYYPGFYELVEKKEKITELNLAVSRVVRYIIELLRTGSRDTTDSAREGLKDILVLESIKRSVTRGFQLVKI